ncbi:nuclear transport factor 2 family protein [Thalassotalea euphylliae]|uniref:Nuclear transport factor 2 family protein n=1 Tax=Thalassotalea euphylliae TaxID=1655234 RepID=A0A3E0TRA5_9GAMM|nr:nuclear transport factor 2 family protein [Thalassotalea euphylliae]REL27099.1 nuclear transport factor 2 family protein [Thalassotalea euphylliae]
MNKLRFALLLILLTPFFGTLFGTAYANETGEEKAVINQLLNDFLANTINDDLKNHQRFWADDLIYTSSSGARFDKAHIIEGIEADLKATAMEHTKESHKTLPPLYWAEQTDIRIYGSTAIVAFKLMHKENANATEVKQTYFNTGTLLKRNGIWQVIAWQATKIPHEN